MNHTATYSPEDNKLRLYPAFRLDPELYQRVKAKGFIWAPKQELFVAPMWTPDREDFLTELCGEIQDEDTSLVDRAEAKAERLEDLSERKQAEADRAHKAVAAIADNIPLGQPILVGHHSERHARKDAERIQNGMRKAVDCWKASEYWSQRAAGALRHAKYKELPAVRYRRIKGLESDKRKQEKYKAEAEQAIRVWTAVQNETDPEKKKRLALAACNLPARFPMPKKEGDRPDWDQRCGAYEALTGDYPSLYAPRTIDEVVTVALSGVFERSIDRYQRWIDHYTNRIAYERAMLGETGGIVAEHTKPEKGGGVKCWASHRGGWSYIQKVNKVSVTVLDNWGNGGGNFTRTIPFDKLNAVMTKAQVEAARAAGSLVDASDGTGYFLNDSVTPTAADKARESQTDADADAAPFKALEESLRAGVQVVTAPQLFPTPPDLAEQMVEAADLHAGQRVLEPSAGTGQILGTITHGHVPVLAVAIEINSRLVDMLRTQRQAGAYPSTEIIEGDFLEQNGNLGKFDRVLMNPPFENGTDIKHIKHALTFLKPGGRLVAICARFEDAESFACSVEWDEHTKGQKIPTRYRWLVAFAVEGESEADYVHFGALVQKQTTWSRPVDVWGDYVDFGFTKVWGGSARAREIAAEVQRFLNCARWN